MNAPTTVPFSSVFRGECREGKCVPFCEGKGQVSCICDKGKLGLLINTTRPSVEVDL